MVVDPSQLEPLVALAARADAVVRASIPDPTLVSVLVTADPDTGTLTAVQCRFHRQFRRWFGGEVLDVFLVRLVEPPTVTRQGRYRREYYCGLATANESAFPVRPIDIGSIRVEPAGALRLACPPARAGKVTGLVLTMQGGEPVWGTSVFEKTGIRALTFSAVDGRMLAERFHRLSVERGA